MAIKPVWVREDDLSSLVEIPVRGNQVMAIRNTLHLIGVPEVGPAGGTGFIIGDGAVSISGTKTACEKAVDAILLRLNGPGFKTGLEVATIHQKGALP
jgi:hypothetical protein